MGKRCDRDGIRLSFMTQNLYLGADLTVLLTAPPDLLPQRVTEVYRQFLATDFPERAEAIAGQIARKKPHLIGLQEAEIWQLSFPDGRTVTFDFIQILLKALSDRELRYEVAATNNNYLAELPTSHGNVMRLRDRSTILLRKGCGLKVIARQEANFQTNLTLQIGGQPFVFLRGWSSVDVCVHGQTFRMINAHLQVPLPPIPESAVVQVAQGQELLAGPAGTERPVVLLGDMTNPAGALPTYGNFINAGFQDVWTEAGQGPGLTCCQDPDLLSATSLLNRRVDLILFKDGWEAIRADVVGEEQGDRTPTGLWPSDHAGVSATLLLQGDDDQS